ncbi:MAG: hypothetical protein K0R50_1959 [Eubacterium sp.]|nr:hypothetical protein [Eubacterium sp.]
MKEFLLIRLLDKFEGGFNKLDIDYFQLRMILKIKLTLDSRSVPTVLSGSKNIENRNIPVLSMLMYGFMGLMISVFVWIPFSIFYKMNIILGMIIFMILATMISDFSTVLLDVKEKNILLPRPIKENTIKMAKTIHILYYLVRITLALSGPTIIMCFFKYGPGVSIVLFFEIILICGLVMFFTSIIYYAILSLFDGEKLKDIINYFQIILTIFITIAYQFTGRMFDLSAVSISFTPKWWNYLIPTTWFAAPLSIMTEKKFDAFYIIASALAVIVPVAAFVIYIKYILPYFEKNLQKLNSNNGRNFRKVRSLSLQRLIALLVCADNRERAVYSFTQNMIASERKLKLQLYPSLAFAVIMPFILMFVSFSRGNLSEAFTALRESSSYFGIYIGIAMASISVNFISKSEKFKGAWIYRALPVENPAIILRGALKAFIYKYNIPLITFLSVICVLLYGPRIIPDIFLMFINMMLLLIAFFKLASKQLPFSQDFQSMKQGTNAGVNFALLFVAGLLAAVHYGVSFIPFGITANIAVSALITILIWHNCFKISWKDIGTEA